MFDDIWWASLILLVVHAEFCSPTRIINSFPHYKTSAKHSGQCYGSLHTPGLRSDLKPAPLPSLTPSPLILGDSFQLTLQWITIYMMRFFITSFGRYVSLLLCLFYQVSTEVRYYRHRETRGSSRQRRMCMLESVFASPTTMALGRDSFACSHTRTATSNLLRLPFAHSIL